MYIHVCNRKAMLSLLFMFAVEVNLPECEECAPGCIFMAPTVDRPICTCACRKYIDAFQSKCLVWDERNL